MIIVIVKFYVSVVMHVKSSVSVPLVLLLKHIIDTNIEQRQCANCLLNLYLKLWHV